MNKLTNILLIGLLFFSDIKVISIKKNYLRLSSKKNSLSKIIVSKDNNPQQQTQQTKDQIHSFINETIPIYQIPNKSDVNVKLDRKPNIIFNPKKNKTLSLFVGKIPIEPNDRVVVSSHIYLEKKDGEQKVKRNKKNFLKIEKKTTSN